VYLFENNFKQQNDADSNNNEDAGVEMLTDVTPVGRVAGQLYAGQNDREYVVERSIRTLQRRLEYITTY
jgi:hypothetical protein